METRRAVLAASLAAFASITALPFAATAARAQSTPIGAIRVDVSPLVAKGWGETAGAVRIGMERALADAFGAAYQPGRGPVLLVKVRGIFMASYAGGGGGGAFGGGGSSNDSLDSETTLLGPGDRVIGTWPILSTISSGSGGAWYLPDVDQRRIAALIENNALWIRRYVGR